MFSMRFLHAFFRDRRCENPPPPSGPKASRSRRPRGAYGASTVARAAVPTEKPLRTWLGSLLWWEGVFF